MSRFLATLDRALEHTITTPADDATVELARRYARALDDDGDLTKIGPLLLTALTALGMTPKARSAVTEGGTPDAPRRDPLDDLESRRAARKRPS